MNRFFVYPKFDIQDFAFFTTKEGVSHFFGFDYGQSFLENPIVNLQYEDEFSKQELVRVFKNDVYETTLNTKVFTKKVADVLSELDPNITFFPCTVNGEPSELFALYKKLTQESKYIIHDDNEKYGYSYFVSQDFVDLAKKEKWVMEFMSEKDDPYLN